MIAKVKTGRPAKSEDERLVSVPVRFPPAMIARIQDQPEMKNEVAERSTMVRTLVLEALEARAKRSKGGR